MIDVRNLTKKYAAFTAVADVSFTVQSGEILGLLGPNGAGKSTILKTLAGCHFPTQGSVLIHDLDVTSSPVEVKKLIGYLPEKLPLYDDFTVLEYLNFIASARLIENKDEQIRKMFEQFDLLTVMHKPIRELSKGFKQRVGLAQALIHDPDIVILDEPTNGLDPNQIQEYRRNIQSLGTEKTIILSSHILQEIEALCDRVVILNKGRVQAAGTPAEISKELHGAEKVLLQAEGISQNDLSSLTSVLSCKKIADGHTVSTFEIMVTAGEVSRKDIYNLCVSKNAVIYTMQLIENSLEELFSSLTHAETQQDKTQEGSGND